MRHELSLLLSVLGCVWLSVFCASICNTIEPPKSYNKGTIFFEICKKMGAFSPNLAKFMRFGEFAAQKTFPIYMHVCVVG